MGVGIGGGDSGTPAAPLLDVNGNPIEAVYTDDGQVVPPRMVDEQGNVVHEGPEKKEGMGTGTKVAIVGAAGLAGIAALTAGAAATGVGVHYYKKKKKEGGSKERKIRKERKIKKIRKERKTRRIRRIKKIRKERK